MNLQRLLELAIKLLSLKNENHSITEAICRKHLFDGNTDPTALANTFQQVLGGQNYTPQLLDWVNVLLFNVCGFNEEIINHYEGRMLESTEDAPKQLSKQGKLQASTVELTVQIRMNLKKWLQKMVNLPFIQRILLEASQKTISKSKSLRSLLETIDYLAYKYQLTTTQRDKITTLLSAIDRKSENVMVLERASWTNKRIFSGAEHLVNFLNELADNYTINLSSIASLISANYFHSNPPRKPFQTAINSGQVIVEEIVDFLIRKCGKNDLFSQKMDAYRPFQLLMEVLFQKFGSVLIDFNEVIASVLKNSTSSLYHSDNHKKIQTMASLFSYQLQNNYPRLQHLLRYTYSSLLAKYTPVDSLELMKKFILNRFLLNPFYFALLHSPTQQQMERYVRVANDARILFYEKKMETVNQQYKSSRLNQLAELLRNSLTNMLHSEEGMAVQNHTRCDKGVYINDTLLGVFYYEISDVLKGTKRNSKPNTSEVHSESSLSFSLRNDSASRMQMPTNQHLPISSNNSSLPQLPKPRSNPRQQTSQRNTSKIVSTEAYLEQPEHPIDKLQDLVTLRRQYGELKRQIEVRTTDRSSHRNSWRRQLQLINQPISAVINQLSKSSSQLLIHSLLL